MFPLNVTFHNTRRSQSAEEEVRENAERLDKLFQDIQSCEVTIDKPHHHHNKGNEFHVKLLLSVKGQKVAVNSSSPKHGDHTSLHVALRDAFEAARRQLRGLKQKKDKRRTRETRPLGGTDEILSAAS